VILLRCRPFCGYVHEFVTKTGFTHHRIGMKDRRVANFTQSLNPTGCRQIQIQIQKNIFRLKTDNKSTGEAQPAKYLKSRRTDYTTQCQLGNAKQENDELNPA
jgi:hypothetical protein